MLGIFKKNPIKKLQKEHAAIMQKARDVQRSGDLKAYAVLIEQADALAKQTEAKQQS